MENRLNRREFWTRLGYIVTAAWMVVVLAITNGDAGDPLFQFIFIVPLSAWILALLVVRVVVYFRTQRSSPRKSR